MSKGHLQKYGAHAFRSQYVGVACTMTRAGCEDETQPVPAIYRQQCTNREALECLQSFDTSLVGKDLACVGVACTVDEHRELLKREVPDRRVISKQRDRLKKERDASKKLCAGGAGDWDGKDFREGVPFVARVQELSYEPDWAPPQRKRAASETRNASHSHRNVATERKSQRREHGSLHKSQAVETVDAPAAASVRISNRRGRSATAADTTARSISQHRAAKVKLQAELTAVGEEAVSQQHLLDETTSRLAEAQSECKTLQHKS